tara:strand:+ start:10509 stop:10874 length:366 start_codon:yes stop_codon:yes gene_type:complete
MRFEELDVWKRSARLSAALYKYFIRCRDYGFRDQITRAGLSIPSNIAEGHERESSRDKVRFLVYAKGSAGELRAQVLIGMEAGYIDRETGDYWCKEAEGIARMLYAMIKGARQLDGNRGFS